MLFAKSRLYFASVYGSGRLTAYLGLKQGSGAKRLLFNLLLKLTMPLPVFGRTCVQVCGGPNNHLATICYNWQLQMINNACDIVVKA